MEQNDGIAYKTWVENLQEPAPEGAWNAIADQLDIDAAWDGISETLDLDDVWQNIETELPQTVPVSNPAAPAQFPKLFWLAAALILFTLTTPVADKRTGQEQSSYSKHNIETKLTEHPKQETLKSSETKRADQLDNKAVSKTHAISTRKEGRTGYSESSVSGNRQTDEPNDEQVLPRKNYPDFLHVFPTAPLPDSIFGGASSAPFLLGSIKRLSKPQTAKPAFESSIEADSLTEVAANSLIRDSVQCERDQPGRAKWQVGIIGSIKNTWLINPETTNGLKRSSLNDTRVTFGKEFGVTVQRSIGGASDIQFEYYFYSEIGQRYHEYINALYQTKAIRLRYQKFQVLYRTRILRNLNAPALYATGGIRISRLTLADTSIGDESQEVTQEYRPWDYGFILGGEAEFTLTNKLLLVSGLRASYGLRNIYLGTSQAPAEFNKTNTASIGLMLGLKYRIN